MKCQQKPSLSNLFVTYREFVKKMIHTGFKHIYFVCSMHYVLKFTSTKIADTDTL